MSSTQPTIQYNIYRITLSQSTPRPHEGIALVPAHLPLQTAGRFYHVKGSVGIGMDFEARPGYNFGADPSYQGSVFQFQLPKSYLKDFEEIAGRIMPPHDIRALMERNPDPPVRDCGAWVNEVLEETRGFLRGKGVDVEGQAASVKTNGSELP